MTDKSRRIPRHSGVRVIAGSLRGRRLRLPEGTRVRPTPDRVRETLFNWLGARVAGARCLDLYAGSGVLGIEALSRGAAAVRFVEADRRLASALRSRLEAFGLTAPVEARRVERFLDSDSAERFDLIFLDPPYEQPLEPIVAKLWPFMTAEALIYMERARTQGLPEIDGLQWLKRSRAAAVSFGLAQCEPGA